MNPTADAKNCAHAAELELDLSYGGDRRAIMSQFRATQLIITYDAKGKPFYTIGFDT